MTTVDDDAFYRDARANRQRKPRAAYGSLDAETAAARQSENTRRNMEARRRATQAIANLYPEVWARLSAAARREVDAERGPLPGDEVDTAAADYAHDRAVEDGFQLDAGT